MLMIITVRYKGLDIATNFIPHAGIVMWLGKHAYEYSQPKTSLKLNYIGSTESIKVTVSTEQQTLFEKLTQHSPKTIDLGHIQANPKLSWDHVNGSQNVQEINVESYLKKIGKNMTFEIEIDDVKASIKIKNRD
jgi:hypothetical protein